MPAQDILTGLNSAIPSILSQLETINRQINFATKAPNAVSVESARNQDNRIISDSRGNPVLDFKPIESEAFTGITASRRNAKPFIIGFIPPDNPINFVPIQTAFDQVSIINTGPSTLLPAQGSGGVSLTGQVIRNFGNDGLVKKQWVSFSRSEFRDAMYESYKKQTGREPTEAWLRMACAQVWLETGALASGDTIRAPNYNLGATHATAHGVDYMYARDANGNYVSEVRGKQRFIVTTATPTESAVPQPSSGSWYISDDYRPVTDGQGRSANQPYRQSYWAFPDLQSAVDYQASLLIVRWPNTVYATNEEEYVDALTERAGSHYFEAPRSVYQKNLETQARVYDREFPEPKGTIQPTQAEITAELTETQRNPRRLLTYGQKLGSNSEDKLSGRWGRTVRPDDERREYTDKQVEALRAQIENLKKIPPLLLLINPSEFNRSYEHTVDSSVKTRNGHIVHMWIEKPLSISASGVTAGQYIIDASGRGGLTTEHRVHSLSYANLSSLVGIYKNNGRIFIGDEANPANRGVQLLAFTVFIYYDEHIYLGSFDDFGVTDSADKPFNMSYSMKFNVRYDMAVPAKPESQYRETDHRISRGVATTRATGE